MRGFAALSPERQRELASQGGKAAHAMGRAHKFTPEEARAAGKKGGARVAAIPGHMAAIGRLGGATQANIPGRMAELGKKGGEVVSRNAQHMREIGRVGGAVTTAQRKVRSGE